MGTRSTIALEFADGTVGQVYCHWDGYLSNNGKILFEDYQDPFKLRDLIDLGDLSSLRREINPEPFREHNFDKSQEDVCIFYGRDRGEENVGHIHHPNFREYEHDGATEGYNYLFRDGKWLVQYDSDGFKDLETAVNKEND